MSQGFSSLPPPAAFVLGDLDTLTIKQLMLDREQGTRLTINTASYGEDGVFYPAQSVCLFGKSARNLYDRLKEHFDATPTA